LGVDFFSVAGDTTSGHFALFIRPQNQASADSVLPKRIFFLLSKALNANKLSASITSIERALDNLSSADFFNIVTYDYYEEAWRTEPQAATTANIEAAKTFLATINISSETNMMEGLNECLSQIENDSLNNSIIVFTDGYSPIDPRELANKNQYNTGIFPIGIGQGLSFYRLEMLAALNYGFVTYISEDDNILQKMDQTINKISSPILKKINMEYNKSDITSIVPEKTPSAYAGSYFYFCGRYDTPGQSALSVGGSSPSGYQVYDFLLNYSDKKSENKFVEKLWAKIKIDQLELTFILSVKFCNG